MDGFFVQLKDFPDYCVTDDGQVISLRTKSGPQSRSPSWRTLSQTVSKKGYSRISLRDSTGKLKSITTHRLVLEAFTGKNSLHINHINGIKSDNRLENLEWCTPVENNKHALETGLVNNNGESSGRCKLTSAEVTEIRSQPSSMSHVSLARSYGVSAGQIALIRKFKSRKIS
jgi:hypothetical protein